MPGLGAALGIDGITRGRELVQDVEGLQLSEQFAMDERADEFGIPNPVGGVHLVLLIASAGKHGQIGRELEMPRKVNSCVKTYIVVTCMDVGEAFTTAVNIGIGAASMKCDLIVVVRPEIEFQFILQLPVVHDAAHTLHTRGCGGHIDIVLITAR